MKGISILILNKSMKW